MGGLRKENGNLQLSNNQQLLLLKQDEELCLPFLVLSVAFILFSIVEFLCKDTFLLISNKGSDEEECEILMGKVMGF